MLKISALKLLMVTDVQMYITNSVDNTKLPCCTLPLTQHHNFFRNLPLLFSNVQLTLDYPVALRLDKVPTGQ